MFGYIKPCRAELKVKEFEAYRGVYCGLCRRIGKEYGLLARCTLSYDYAFLALLQLTVQKADCAFTACRCIAHPTRKRCCLKDADALSFTAAAAMLMLSQKAKDRKRDDGIRGRLFAGVTGPYFRRLHKKAAARFPKLAEHCEKIMPMQWEAEAKPDCTPDEAAHPTADTLGKILSELSEDETERRVLYRLGYCMGRWIYFMDALDDLETDKKRQRFNPLLLRFGTDEEKCRDYAVELLQQSDAEAAAAYELLDAGNFSPVLENIIYLGMKQEQNRLLDRKKECRA